MDSQNLGEQNEKNNNINFTPGNLCERLMKCKGKTKKAPQKQ